MADLFMKVVEALERANDEGYEAALDITRKNCQNHDFVNARDLRNGCVDRQFQYRYHLQPRIGFTLLHYATLYKQTEMIELLIQHGADPLQTDVKFKSTALHLACIFWEKDTVAILLASIKECCREKLEVVINQPNMHGWCPLYYAAERKRADIIQLLLENGADPNRCYMCSIDEIRIEVTALIFLSGFSSPECIKEIFRKRSKKHCDCEEYVALNFACRWKRRDNLCLLLKHTKVDEIDATKEAGFCSVHCTEEARIPLRTSSPLHVAIENSATECVLLLLDAAKLNINSWTQNDDLLLKTAVLNLDEPEIILGILELHDPTFPYKGSTLLHKIVESDAYSDEEFEKVVKLIGKNCIEYEDNYKRTPLMLAAMLNKHQKLKILQDTYLCILRDNFFSPNQEGSKEIYKNLLAKRDVNGNCAVHLAVKHEGLDVDFERTIKVLDELRKVKILYSDVEKDPLMLCTKFGLTGLQEAIGLGKAERAVILLEVCQGRLSDTEISTFILYAIEHNMPPIEFEKFLKIVKSSHSIRLNDIFGGDHIPINEVTLLSNIRAIMENAAEEKITIECGEKLLDAAIEAKRPDIIKYLLVKKVQVSHRHLERVIIDHANKELAMLLVRYAQDAEHIVKELDKESKGVVLFHELIRTMEGVAEEALYRNAEIIHDSGRVELIDGSHPLVNNEHQFQIEPSHSPMSNTDNTLEVMVKHEALTLLKHPVVYKLIQLKWYRLGLPLYVLQVMLYLPFIIPLSFLALLPTANNTNLSGLAGYLIVVSFIYLAYTIIQFCVLQIQDFRHRKKGGTRPKLKATLNLVSDFLFKMLTFLLALAFACLTVADTVTGPAGCCTDWQWHLGLFAISLSWANMIRLFFKFPAVGEHAIIYETIVLSFVRMAVFALLLILAFTIVLMKVFFNEDALQSPFFNFRRGFVTVLTMVTGELGYLEAFSLSYDATNSSAYAESSIIYPDTANLVWVVFLILLPILLTNMLTALAVGDVIDLRKRAELTQLEQQVKLVTRADSNLVKRCFERCQCKFRYLTEDFKRNKMIMAYNEKRMEDMEDIKSGEDSKQDIVESIKNVKTVALSCEKRIRELKKVYDDSTDELKSENSKIRRENEQLASEVRMLQLMIANKGDIDGSLERRNPTL